MIHILYLFCFAELEHSYETNQAILENKAIDLAELEETARRILDEISRKVAQYISCQY